MVFKHGKLKYYNTKIIETCFTEVYEYAEVIGYGFTNPVNETNGEYIKDQVQNCV